MTVSIFDLFKIGIGPSSSHTVGPMKAACAFAQRLEAGGLLERVRSVRVRLHGSLAHTGKGHATDRAVLLGLQGELPATVDPESMEPALQRIQAEGVLRLLGRHPVTFSERDHLVFDRRKLLPHHSNGMNFQALGAAGEVLDSRDYYSVGGGFVVDQEEAAADRVVDHSTPIPFPFDNADQLLEISAREGMRISAIVLENEKVWRSEQQVIDGLLEIHAAMITCMERGFRQPGILPGGLGVVRRAPLLYRELGSAAGSIDPLSVLDWVNLCALAVNEENAAGGRVVTAPTNGAAGIVPAVLRYYVDFVPGANDEGIVEFMLTAGAIGILFMQNASISGAEVGCQGEVGVACSMAAGGLTAATGGNMSQVENAAEIGMEHNLGLTCDPVGGLVQIPCIERNAMAAVKAINAQRMALRGGGEHRVSLDKVIKTMRDTGADMKTQYKETSRGGLAVNLIEC